MKKPESNKRQRWYPGDALSASPWCKHRELFLVFLGCRCPIIFHTLVKVRWKAAGGRERLSFTLLPLSGCRDLKGKQGERAKERKRRGVKKNICPRKFCFLLNLSVWIWLSLGGQKAKSVHFQSFLILHKCHKTYSWCQPRVPDIKQQAPRYLP